MVILKKNSKENILKDKAKKIKLVLTDNDGVLTDASVYYSAQGEEMKKYSVRDGMGVERLRKTFGIETGIITGETSESLKRRAEKLDISELHLGAKRKSEVLMRIIQKYDLQFENVAYIGDDLNDLSIILIAGFTACPSDAVAIIQNSVYFICPSAGGHGAFRDFAEFIISSKS